MALGQLADPVQLRDRAIHAEYAVGRDQLAPRPLRRRLPEAAFEVGHVAGLVTPPLCLAQPHAIDDRGVVQRVRDDRVLLAEQRLEHAAVGVEARRVQDRVLGAQELGDLAFQRLVQVLRATDEAHRAESEAVRVERGVRRPDHLRVARQTEVVVGAEHQHLATVGERDGRALRRGEHALVLPQSGVTNRLELGLELGLHAVEHDRIAPRLIGSGTPRPQGLTPPAPTGSARPCRRCPSAAGRSPHRSAPSA